MNLPENSNSMQQQQVLDQVPALIFLERAGRIVFANAEARHLLGWAEETWGSRPVEEVLWGLFPGTAEPQTALIGGRSSSPFHATVKTGDGRLVAVEGTYCTVNAELRDAVIVAQATARDRAPRPRLMEDVLASIPDAVVLVRGSHVLYTNTAFTRLFGYTADEVSGGDLRSLIVPETRLHEHAMVEKACAEYGLAALDTVRTTKEGNFVDVAIHVAPLLVGGKKAGHVLTYRDIGDRKQVEAKLLQDAMHDVVTGLPNRSLFQDRVNRALMGRMRHRDQGCGVLLLVPDHFEEINDTAGQAAADMLLIALAERIRILVRPQDTVARLSRAEFAILVENVVSISDVEVVARRVLEGLAHPFEVFGFPFTVGMSIGVAVAELEGATAELLVRDASVALYHARQAGGQRYEVFDRHMGVETESLLVREHDLRQALSNRKFELWYEPIYRLASGELEGFESILRFRRRDGTVEDLNELLPAAEETGLSISIGREALDAVCRQLCDWSKALPGNRLMLTVNLTHRQFYHDDMVAHLKRTLEDTKADPSRLMLEVPEAALNERPDAALAIVQRMADCGVRVALDNFGADLAPFNHLMRMPIDLVKMDPSLTIGAIKNGPQLALIESLIHVGKSAGVRLAAQGVETREQLGALRQLGCELGQGPLFASAAESMDALQIAVEQHRSLLPSA